MNSGGSYRSKRENLMAAFDKLPRDAREALANAAFSWAVQPLLTRWRKRIPGYRTGSDIADTIARWDREHLYKAEIRRGKR